MFCNWRVHIARPPLTEDVLSAELQFYIIETVSYTRVPTRRAAYPSVDSERRTANPRYSKGRLCAVPAMAYLEKHEIDAMLSVPDRARAQGRRDYALLLFLYYLANWPMWRNQEYAVISG